MLCVFLYTSTHWIKDEHIFCAFMHITIYCNMLQAFRHTKQENNLE